MWPILQAIFTGVTGSVLAAVKNYLEFKKQESQNKQELKLAELNANKELAIATIQGDTDQRSNYLNSVSKRFRQGTFYLVTAMILIGTWDASFATPYWNNFAQIPAWLRGTWVGMLSVTWGFPIAKEYIAPVFSAAAQSVSNFQQAHREYKLEKYRINRKAYFDKKREMLNRPLSQQEVDADNAALDAVEE